MKKRAFAALTLALLFVVSGCKLVEKDLSVDAKTVVAEISGKKILKGEANMTYNSLLSQYSMFYAMYGMSFSPTASDLAEFKQMAVNSIAQRIINDDQLVKQGLNFTEEELAKIQSDADSNYEDELAYDISTLQASNAELSEEAAREQVIKTLDAQGYTKQLFYDEIYASAVTAKLRENAVKDISISDAEAKAEYDQRVADQKTKYDGTPAQFGTDVTGTTMIVYRPEGYRYVKNLLIGIPSELQTEITSLESTISSNSSQRTSLQSQLDSAGDDEVTKNLLAGMIADLDLSDETSRARIEELRAQAKEQIKPQAENLLRMAQGPGADFDALITQFGTDGGMKSEPAKTNGYPISEATTTYVQPFHDAAMALAKPGDISNLVETDYGYHIIQYASDIPAGEIPFDDVKAAISDELLTAKQDSEFTAKQDEWFKAGNLKTYLNRWTD